MNDLNNSEQSNVDLDETILRAKDIKQKVGFSTATLYRHINEGIWPKPIRLGGKAVGWFTYEVDALIAAHVAENTKYQIKALVNSLEKLRTASAESCFFRNEI